MFLSLRSFSCVVRWSSRLLCLVVVFVGEGWGVEWLVLKWLVLVCLKALEYWSHLCAVGFGGSGKLATVGGVCRRRGCCGLE